MALNDTTNTAVRWLNKVFPDWGQEILLTQIWQTDVLIASKGAEQRVRRRELPRYAFKFVQAAQDPKAWSKRHLEAIRELGAPLGCPIWTHPFAFDSEASGVVTLVTDGMALSKTPFQVGQYALFVDGDEVYSDEIRPITAIDDLAETITVGDPVSGDPVPPWSSATVYPVLIGMRNESNWTINRVRVDLTDEIMDFIQL